MNALLFVLTLMFSTPPAQPPQSPCMSAAEARQFDFWIGEWDVFAPGGGRAGSSVIQQVSNGCAILENWTGARGGTGKSINFYDPQAGKWFQYWIGSDGTPHRFSGVYRDNAMRFDGEPFMQNGKRLISRLTLFNIDANTVRQLAEQSDDDGRSWSVAYDFKYVRHVVAPALHTSALKINVADVDASLAFYTEKLGFAIADRSGYPEDVVLKTNDGVKLILHQVAGVQKAEPLESQVGVLVSEIVESDFKSWKIADPNARTEEHLGRKSLFLRSGAATLNDVSFQDGVIDVDIAMTSKQSFVGVIFRAQNADDFEIVYFRPFKSGQPDAVQYTPSFNGSAGWQLFSGPGFTAATEIPYEQWVHVRIEVAGITLKVFFNDSAQPVLVNNELRRGYSRGSIGLWGIAAGGYFSNFRYQAREPEQARPLPPPRFAAGTLTKWELSDAFSAAERDPEKLPDVSALKWEPAGVETPGMVVIDRYRRSPDKGAQFSDAAQRVGPRPERRVVFARTTIESDRDQIKRMSLGYSDEVTVFLNGQPLYTGRSAFRYRDPGFLGIMDVENDAVYLPLKKGRNELVLAVAEYFGGWGFICRVEM